MQCNGHVVAIGIICKLMYIKSKGNIFWLLDQNRQRDLCFVVLTCPDNEAEELQNKNMKKKKKKVSWCLENNLPRLDE